MKILNEIIIKNKKGITLVSLIITIVVMLILATVTIGAINGGLFNYAGRAKEEVDKTKEVDTIKEAIIFAKENNKEGKLLLIDFQNEINDRLGEGVATVYDNVDGYLVLYNTNRLYTVDSKGNLLDEVEEYKQPTHTFLAQTTNNTLGTSEDTAYEINSIEDLLDLSFAVNGITLTNGEFSYETNYKTFANKFVKLCRNLNFKSNLSYEDPTRTDYGDINGNGEVEGLLIELTTGKGWIPIGGYKDTKNSNGFIGTFYGEDGVKKISGLYINNIIDGKNMGLFGSSYGIQIKDISVSGQLYSNAQSMGGLVAYFGARGTYNITNCSFSGTIESISEDNYVGVAGIIGYLNTGVNGIVTIKDCFCKGTIKKKSEQMQVGAGGICGYCNATVTVENSHNEAKIEGGSCVGGISGKGLITVKDSFNSGLISGTRYVGGIVGHNYTEIKNSNNTGIITGTGNNVGGIAGYAYAGSDKIIRNCYNTGTINGASGTAGILGSSSSANNLTIQECYNAAEVDGTNYVSGIVGQVSGTNAHILNCYNTKKIKGTQQVLGIAGTVSGTTATTIKLVSCYNIGTLAGTTSYAISSAGIIENCYYLNTCGATSSSGTSKTEAELKALAPTLDKAFTIDDDANTVQMSTNNEVQNVWITNSNINNGYPIFKWQA